MFRRKSTEDDPLLHAPLPARVAAAHSRLAHQDDPALIAALSERELRDERAAAELVRDHQRSESIEAVKSAQTIAGEVRRAQEEMVRAEAADLVVARRAIAERLRSSSATFDIARLHRQKQLCARGLTAVVMASMLWSALNVQHNVAPGGPSDPLYWGSYLLEATISIVLVVFMVSGASVSRWGVTEGEHRIRRIEYALLAGSIGLNVYPYVRELDAFGAVVHAVAPVMVGVALFAHPVVQRRYGLAIDRAKAAADAEGDDIAERLDALTATAARTTPTVPARAVTPPAEDEAAVLAEYEDELRAIDDPATTPLPRASEDASDDPRATSAAADRARTDEAIARDEQPARGIDRAPIAREDSGPARGTIAQSIARAAHTARDTDTLARPVEDGQPAPIARDEQSEHVTDRAPIAHGDDSAARAEGTSIAAHTQPELETDHAPIAAHDSDHTLTDAIEDERPRAEITPVEEPIAREQETIDRARTPIALVSIAREDTDRARPWGAARARGGNPPRGRAPARPPPPGGARARDRARAERARRPIARGRSRPVRSRTVARGSSPVCARGVGART
ncbi:hypothetical protein, partial [Nocardia neocaledoniensis]|uniref:hypothetical protein n=1 Tax=Nocardia neocaledoniensis TaxID=236511 RepID=UPI002453A8A2